MEKEARERLKLSHRGEGIVSQFRGVAGHRKPGDFGDIGVLRNNKDFRDNSDLGDHKDAGDKHKQKAR